MSTAIQHAPFGLWVGLVAFAVVLCVVVYWATGAWAITRLFSSFRWLFAGGDLTLREYALNIERLAERDKRLAIRAAEVFAERQQVRREIERLETERRALRERIRERRLREEA